MDSAGLGRRATASPKIRRSALSNSTMQRSRLKRVKFEISIGRMPSYPGIDRFLQGSKLLAKKKAPEGALGLLLLLLRQNECCIPPEREVTSVPAARPPLVPLPLFAAGPAM